MDCPLCKTNLQLADRQGVEIDYCPKCRGIWLDRGELEKLVELSAALTRTNVPALKQNQ
jgi:Zn-finger nucleic acid-binding protein